MAVFRHFSEIPLFKYELVMADPPWDFETYSTAGNDRSPQSKYETMSFDKICDIPVGSYCRGTALLWLWITAPLAHRADEVMKAWGFSPVTMGFWGKVQKKDRSKPKMNTGYTLREAGEPYFIGRIGKPKIIDRSVPSLILEPQREASRKPDRAYSHAQRLLAPDCFRLDLFSRQERDGWDAFGNEVHKFPKSA